MNRQITVALIALGSLICMSAGDVFPQGAEVRATGEPVQNASLVRVFPPPNRDPTREAEQIRDEDILSAEQYNDRGVIYSEKGEYDLAISEFNKALEVCPMVAEIYNNRGIAYSEKGEYGLAVSDFTKALEMKPGMAEVYFNRGVTYAKKGQYPLALQDFDRSLELHPNHVPAYVNRGSVHAHLACSDWEKACRLGNCHHLEEAVQVGLCIKMNENDNSSP